MTNPTGNPGLGRHARDQLVEKLTDIHTWLSDDLDATLVRDTAFRDTNEPVTTSAKDSTGAIPYDQTAAEAARQLHGTLRDAVLSVCTERGLTWPGERRTPYLAMWLARNIYSLTVCENAPLIAALILDAHKTAWHAVDTPERPHFHGYCEQCGQSLWARNNPRTKRNPAHDDDTEPTLTCRHCGKRVTTAYQRARIDNELETRLFTANELVDIVRDRLGQNIKPKTVHDMAYRRRERLPVRGRTRDGQKLYRAGDVFHRLRQQQQRRKTGTPT